MNTLGISAEMTVRNGFIHTQKCGSAARRVRNVFYLSENNRNVICQVPKQKKMKNKVEKILLLPLAYFPFGYNV